MVGLYETAGGICDFMEFRRIIAELKDNVIWYN